MQGQKLILVINRMTGVEKRAFSKFLASPYYNQREELVLLWQHLLDVVKGKTAGFVQEEIYELMFPGQKFKVSQFRHACSWLMKKLEQFFVVRKQEGQSVNQQLALARTYREKKLDGLFKKHLETSRKSILEQKLEPERFYAAYQIDFEQYAFIESQNRTDSTNLQGLNISLDQYILVSKLKQSCLMLSHQAVYKVQYDFSFLNLILQFLENNPLLENPAIALYYHCYRAFNENDSDHFYQFKHLLTTHLNDFSTREIRGLLLFALNFCIRQMNEGNQNYDKEAWDFYLLGIDQRLLYENDYLGRFTYKNIVALGIKLKEYEWTAQFIDQYKNDLSPKFQENYFNYNKAQLYFSKGSYGPAMRLLAMLDDSDLLLNFDAKVILIKMYFELEEFDALYSLLDSFSVMLQRKKVIGYHKSYYKELLKLTKGLLELPKGKSIKRDQLIKQIVGKDKFPEKKWFLRMIEI